MKADDNRPRWRPFSEYLERLAQQREEAGLPAVPNCDDSYWDDSYWDDRRRNELLKQQPRDAA
jgi:hypothetical protein